jgi:hypothetical protein
MTAAHKLRFKDGPIILLQNLNIKQGFFSGTILVVRKLVSSVTDAKRVTMCICKHVFMHGQLYVAFLKGRNFNCIKVFGQKTTKNPVFKDILL